MVDAIHLLLNHVQDDILQWGPSELILNWYNVVFTTFNIEHEVVRQSTCGLKVAVNISSQLKNFLLSDSDGVMVVQAAHIDMLKSVIVLIDLIENLPSDVKFDPLPHDLKLIPVLIFIKLPEVYVLGDRIIDFVVELVLGSLHLLVKNGVVLLPDAVVSFEFLLRGQWP